MQSERILENGLVRLEKYIAQKGLCSRREGKQLIIDGKVLVNGTIVREAGFGIDPDHDHVDIIGNREEKTTIGFYKPRGIETTKTLTHDHTGATVLDIHDIIPEYKHLAPVGRLDKDSEGLILLTNDGLVTRAITGEHSEVQKEYIVTVRELVTDEAVMIMSKGVLLDDRMTLPAVVKKINDHTFSIILKEGRKHQIRRMADAVKLTIENLKRIRIDTIILGNKKPGDVWIIAPEIVSDLIHKK